MTLWFVVGTAAELIKLYPIMNEAQQRGVHWRILLTGQSGKNFFNQANDFEISNSNIIELIKNKSDLKNSLMAMEWFLRALFVRVSTLSKRIEQAGKHKLEKNDYLIVHGDTLSTVIGSIYGVRLKLPIVHIEAGMRSHKWRSPFPEEISRRFVSRLATIHMAPDENAAQNLKREGILRNVFVTGGNTIVDSLKLALNDLPYQNSPYVIANIHRFENLHSQKNWHQIINLLIQVAANYKVILVLMPNTENLLKNDTDSFQRLVQAGVVLQKRIPFRQFATLVQGATFVLSDGGSNQQECHYIGKPCLILRDITESLEGLGGSCVLSKFDPEIITNFITDPSLFIRETAFPKIRPTDIIFSRLKL
jgi:UDP-N-acetylglucosamine 2-epimerase (non-hydrolysing)